MVVDFIGTIGKGAVLEHVDSVVVIAEVGIDELVIIRFTQVENALETSIDIFCYLYKTLHVDIDS